MTSNYFEEKKGGDFQGKVILVGDAGVGKSCFLKKFVDGIIINIFFIPIICYYYLILNRYFR